jgi:hypothetical protein
VSTPAKYDAVVVARALLFEVIAQDDPTHLTSDILIRQVVADPDDGREVRTAMRALCDLRESGLIDVEKGESRSDAGGNPRGLRVPNMSGVIRSCRSRSLTRRGPPGGAIGGFTENPNSPL